MKIRFEKILLILLVLAGCRSFSPVEEKAIVSRADYQVPSFWQLPVICGRTYWQIYRIPSVGNLKEKYPELVKLMANGGGESGLCNFTTPNYGLHPGGPFFVTGLRWNALHYADEASRTYGLKWGRNGYVKPEIVEGAKTILEKQKALAAEFGERYLGVRLDEWDNDIGPTLINPGPPPKPGDTNVNPRLILIDYIKSTGENIEVPPRSCEQAVENIKAMFAVVKKTHGEPFFALTSACLYDHYAMEFGSCIAQNEICCQGCVPVRMRMASARGAARQYGKPWWSYMVNKAWAKAGWGWGSQSLFFRKIVLSYMAGCSLYEQESGYANRHVTNSIDYIDALVRAEEFFARYPDRGVPYTPILLGLDWLHGTRGFEAQNPFFYTCGGSPRLYSMVIMGLDTLLPYRGDTPDDDNRIGFIERDNYSLSGSSFGDVFDIMVVNPPSDSATLEKLNAYKAMVLLGEIRWTKPLAERFRDYVMAGGTLFLAADQLAASPDMGWCGIAVGDKTAESRATCDQQGKLIDTLPEGYTQLVQELASTAGTETLFADEERRPLVVRRAVGKGNVLVCMVPSMLDKKAEHKKTKLVAAARETLQIIHDQSLPFKIEGNVEFCINRRNASWVITLINNRGIYKDTRDLVAKVDEGKKALVTITAKIPVRNAVERLAGDKIELTRKNNVVKKMTTIVPPGDVRIVEVNE